MGKAKAKPLVDCYITTVGQYNDWTLSQIQKWIRLAGGKHEARITEETTHLVVAQKSWKSQGKIVQQALDINREYEPEIKIVSFDWLDDSLCHTTKRPESSYLWKKIDPKSMNQVKKPKAAKKVGRTRKAQNDDDDDQTERQEDEIRGPKNTQGMMAEVFYNSTDGFLSESEKKNIERQKECERRAQEEMEEEERERERQATLSKSAAVFHKGAKKARNEIFSENHHIYSDSTNFKYDIQVTKVDTRHNKNERCALTIYESNSEPYTYAMNAQCASTGNTPVNNVLAAIGCNFATAFRVFRKTFKEKTGVDWDDRITHHLERIRQEKRDRGRATGSDAGTVRGVPVSENAARPVKKDEDFASMPFLYHPPAYGPQGEFPKRSEEYTMTPADVGTNGPPAENDRVETWVNGTDGTEVESSQTIRPAQTQGATEQNGAQHSNDVIAGPEEVSTADQPITRQSSTFDGLIDEGLVNFDFDSAPFPHQDTAMAQDRPTEESPFGAEAVLRDASTQDTQGVDETQLAGQAQEKLQDFMDQAGQGEAAGHGDVGVSLPQLELSSSPLEKRKTPSEAEDGQPLAKKLRRMDTGDYFEDE